MDRKNITAWVAGGVLIAIVIFAASFYLRSIGARYGLGVPFRILGPDVLLAGESAVVLWDTSPQNQLKYPSEKIEFCRGYFFGQDCVVLNSDTSNDGNALVFVPSNVQSGKGYLRFTAREQPRGALIPNITMARPAEVRRGTVLNGGDRIIVYWKKEGGYPHVKVEFCTLGGQEAPRCYVLAQRAANTGVSPELTVPQSIGQVSGVIRVRVRDGLGYLVVSEENGLFRFVEQPAVIVRKSPPKEEPAQESGEGERKEEGRKEEPPKESPKESPRVSPSQGPAACEDTDTLRDGLLSYLKFDETGAGQRAKDEMTTNTGTPQGLGGGNRLPQPSTDVPTSMQYANPRSLDFDGSDDVVSIDIDHAKMKNAFSISLWTKNDVAPRRYDGIVSNSVGSSWSQGLGVYYDSEAAVKFFVGLWDTNAAVAPITPGRWNHIVGTWNGRIVRIYVNGAEDTSASFSGSSVGTGPVTVGRVGSDTYNIDGKVDDMRVYSRALTQQEVNDLYQGKDVNGVRCTPTPTLSPSPSPSQTTSPSPTVSPTPTASPSPSPSPTSSPQQCSNNTLDDGIIGYWKLDEASSRSTVADSSGYQHYGTPQGSRGSNVYPQPSTNIPSLRFTDPYSRHFDGYDDYIDIAGLVNRIDTNTGTISLWMRMDANQGTDNADHGIFTVGYTGTNGNYIRLMKTGSNQLHFDYRNGSDIYSAAFTAISTLQDQWRHVVGVWSADRVSLYVDGVRVQAVPRVSTMSRSTLNQTTMGVDTKTNPTRWYKGYLDDVRVYNRAMTDNEIRDLYLGKNSNSSCQ